MSFTDSALSTVIASIVLSGTVFAAASTAPRALATPGSDAGAADLRTLMGNLPQGYDSTNCVSQPVAGGRLATVQCQRNRDPGGPTGAQFTLYRDPALLAADFQDEISYDEPVACPGSPDPSPTTWNDPYSDEVVGSLFCGSFGGQIADLEWTDDANLMLYSTSGPDMAALYRWWLGG
jgi:hypothetical protein